MKFIAFDTEDKGDGNGAFLIAAYDGQPHVFYSKEEFKKYLFQNKEAVFFAHNTLYDLMNIFRTNNKIDKGLSIVFNGGRFISARYRFRNEYRQQVTIRFYDLSNFFRTKLEKVGEMLGLEKLEMPSGEDKEAWIKYCVRDAEIVYRTVEGIVELAGKYKIKRLPSTAPSLAMRIYRNMKGYVLKTYNEEIQDFFREGYYGGRTEVFKVGKAKHINMYDVNSMYPFVMDKFSYPIGKPVRVSGGKFSNYAKYEGMLRVVVEHPKEVEDRYVHIPVLPYRTEKGKLIFPVGYWEGVYTINELRYFKEQGGIIHEVKEGYIYKNSRYLFSDYVAHFYDMKKNSKGVMRGFAKLMLNSLYGKFGQRGRTQKLTNDAEEILKHDTIPYNEDLFLIELKRENPTNVIWSAMITAYARITLHKYMMKCGQENVYYCDTDSIATTTILQENKELGGMKCEAEDSEACFVLPKVYYCAKKIKAKGIKKVSKRRIWRLLFKRSVRDRWKKPIKLKEGLRQNMKINKWVKVKKKLRFKFDKRELDKATGRTEPISIKDFRIKDINGLNVDFGNS